MERDEDGVVLGSTRLSGSQRLHRKGDATREAGILVGPMTAADSPSAISVFRLNRFSKRGTFGSIERSGLGSKQVALPANKFIADQRLTQPMWPLRRWAR
jgi:hypothetical protein